MTATIAPSPAAFPRRRSSALLLACLAGLLPACRTPAPSASPPPELPENSAVTPERHFRFHHMCLELRMSETDLAARRIHGLVTYELSPEPSTPAATPGPPPPSAAVTPTGPNPADATPAGAAPRWLPLNSVGLTIHDVEDADTGRPLQHRVTAAHLLVELPPGASPPYRVRIRYTAAANNKGLYFVLPDADHPQRPPQVYTMSEPLLARYWLPCHDWPDTRWPSDIFITVPERLTAISVGAECRMQNEECKMPNRDRQGAAATHSARSPTGACPSCRSGSDESEIQHSPILHSAFPGLRTFHWHQPDPIDPHMLGFAISEYVVVEDSWHNRPLRAYVHPGDEAKARFTFRRVPEILAFYSTLTGVEYPLPRLDHVAVVDHFHGGMEHVGFSMIAPSMLTTGDDGEAPESDSQFNYIAHMIAHSWFGVLVNYADVRESWLNESFGTYLHLNWYAIAESPDSLAEQMWSTRNGVAAADLAGRDQPLVRPDLTEWQRAGEVYNFDGGKIYWKGAWVLHMLRHQLGDEVFRSAVRAYLMQHRGGSVTTADLQRAFEQASGRDLGPFFQQWVHQAGVPRLRVSYEWDPAASAANIRVQQLQALDANRPAFQLPLDVWLLVGDDWQRHTLDIRQPDQTQPIPCAADPQQLCIDPSGGLLASRVEHKPREFWIRQLTDGPTSLARLQAIEHVARWRDPNTIDALQQALHDGAAYVGIRTRAARALGDFAAFVDENAGDGRVRPLIRQRPEPSTAARSALVSLDAAPEPSLQATIIEQLARWPHDPQIFRLLAGLAASDDLLVQAAACRALTGFPRDYFYPPELEHLARLALPPTGRHVRRAALDAIERLNDPRLLKYLTTGTTPATDHVDDRARLLHVVARLATNWPPAHDRTVEFLESHLSDPRPAVRKAAVQALGRIANDDDLRILRQLPPEADANVRAALDEAVIQAERRLAGQSP